MSPLLRTRLAVIAVFVLAVGICAAGIWRYGYVQALAQLDKQGRADLALAADRFTGELRRFRELSVLLADHPDLTTLADVEDSAAATRLLQKTADKTGAMALIYADPQGRVLAHAGDVVLKPAGSDYFRRAMQGALGSFFGRLGPDGRRVYAYAAPAFGQRGAILGAVVVLVDIAEVEWDWIGGQPPVFFTDTNGRIFLSNRSEILGWQKTSDAEGMAPPAAPAPPFTIDRIGGHELWLLDWGGYLPQTALHLTRPKPVIGMTGHALIDVAPARRVAGLQAAVFVVICMAFGVVLFQLAERRRSLARANAQLENRVASRTAELSQTNIALRREVAERKEAEAALKKAQADLVQAGKLSALGQMSAGISHELNQPLMAIQQFADNGAALMDKGHPQAARSNLQRIADLAARAARIIKNLRAFARNENEQTGRVDLVHVIATAVELTQARLRADGIALNWTPPGMPLFVVGGEVRLGQVFVNLINNAADAMSGQPEKSITIRLDTDPRLSVTVRDTGPGIADPERIFEPFYTTKEVGGEDGMGLGLSISYGLVQSFGGNIRGANAPDGGAIFTVELEPWARAEAAE